MAEYPFKDLLPLDEVLEQEGYYRDWTHLDPEVFYSLTQISEYIKTKGFGIDVRLLIAQLAEHFGLKTAQVVDLANLLQQKFTNLEGVTQSFTNNINSLVAQMEADKNAVIANATVDSEVILARGGKATLGERLDDTTAQLAQTIRMDESNLTLNNFTESDRAVIQGLADGEINAVLGYRNVKPENTTFFRVGKNLFNKDAVTHGYFVNSNTGELVSDSNFTLSEFIEVEPETSYVKSTSNAHAYYDNNYNFISGELTDSFTTPPNTKYIRITTGYGSLDRQQLEKGSSATAYEDYHNVIDKKHIESLDALTQTITKGKNLFDGEYIVGSVAGALGAGIFNTTDFPNSRSAVIDVKPHTYYTISKTLSNRFRVALSKNRSFAQGTDFKVIKNETVGNGDSDTTFTLNTGDYNTIIITVCNPTVDIPKFMQVEEGSAVTKWETYGYKLEPQAKQYEDIRIVGSNDILSVESFREASMSDAEVVQKAFDTAQSQVVSFESGRTYILANTVTADASKVRGIKGNNATLKIAGTNSVALEYLGGKISGGANPKEPLNKTLMDTEMNMFIEHLRVSSVVPYVNNGIKVDGLFSPNINNVMVYKTKDALEVTGRTRNINVNGCHIYDNSQTGLLFRDLSLHQINIGNTHISYNLNGIKFIDSDIANVQISGCDLENGMADGYSSPESIISFEYSGSVSVLYEAIVITGNTIQDHRNNLKPMINIDLDGIRMHDLIIDGNLIGNSSAESVPIYLNGVKGGAISNNSIVGYPSVLFDKSVVMNGSNSNIRIIGNHLGGPIDYSGASVNKLLIANNLTEGFTLPDSASANLKVSGNF